VTVWKTRYLDMTSKWDNGKIMANKLVLVTGGAGFIGKQLSNLLVEYGHHVRILDPLATQIHGAVPSELEWLSHERITFHRGSVTNNRDLTAALEGVDTVINLAAETGTGQSMYEIERYNAINSQGTASLLDILVNSKSKTVKRIILASSRSVYGEGAYVCPSCDFGQTRQYPNPRQRAAMEAEHWEHNCPKCKSAMSAIATHESDGINPASIYAATKFNQEQLTQIACSSVGIDFAILRLQNVYGEGQSLLNPYTGILSVFSTLIRRTKEIPIFEDGKETRDFIHVSDVAMAMKICLDQKDPLNCVMNVGSGIATSVEQVAENLSDAFEVPRNIRITKQFRMGDIRHNFADISTLERRLEFKPKITLEQGLSRFANWVLGQPLPEDNLAKANSELRRRNLMK
jgi:dTDP-L-rhamnose 4-epimerase